MLIRAQCEKAVTISEPIGHALDGFCATPKLGSGVRAGARLFVGRNPMNLERLAPSDLCLVFNDLRAVEGLKSKRCTSTPQYLQNRAFVLLQGGWFGPSFVTIMPTGVGVCSF
jgi:hypothetical protein